MGYVFKPGESIATNLNRILAEQVHAAIEALENPGESKGETIHGVRKRIKKIRALFRMVRSELDRKAFQRANTYYRALAHTLSALRDATVMIKTLEKLRQIYPDRLSARVFAILRKALADQQDQVSSAFFEDETNIRNVAEAFRQAPLTIPDLAENDNSFSVFRPNLARIYRRGRKALQVATKDPRIHNWHELRKDVKTIWYHTRLFQPIWPGLFAAYGQEFGRLGELLGDDHDFGILAQQIESDRLLLRNRQSKKKVLDGLHQQRAELQAQILPLANRLFAEKTSAFVDRYRLYWKLWQAEAKRARTSDKSQVA